jgi:hypothetical protein
MLGRHFPGEPGSTSKWPLGAATTDAAVARSSSVIRQGDYHVGLADLDLELVPDALQDDSYGHMWLVDCTAGAMVVLPEDGVGTELDDTDLVSRAFDSLD